MRSYTFLAATALSLASVAGAQQVASKQAVPGKTTHVTASAPVISRDSAKTIALANVKGATVTSEKLQTRKGEKYYLFTMRNPTSKSLVRATVDATNGHFSRLDRAPSK